jgi:hypothetical protein
MTCGFGACCPSFSSVQGLTRTPLKSPILMVQSVRKFTRVHRRWGQHWGQSSRKFYLRLHAIWGCGCQEVKENLGWLIQSWLPTFTPVGWCEGRHEGALGD